MERNKFFFFAFLCLYSFSVRAQRLENPTLHSLVLAGIDLTLKQEYASADSIFRVVEREFPSHPSGYLYRAAVLQSKAMDYEAELDVASFDSLIALGKEKAEEQRRKASSSPWGHFFLGTALGYDSYARVYRREWFGGVTKGLSSVSEFKKALEKDSSCYDAWVGIGTYYYWKSRKTEFLHWLPFVSDSRQEGINVLERSAQKGVYNKFAALSALVAIYLDARDFDAAERCATLGLNSYPTNRTFLWGLATALHNGGKLDRAAKAYRNLLDILKADTTKNIYNEIVCRLNLVKVKLLLSDSTDAENHIRVILSFENEKFPEHLNERVTGKFEDAKKIMAELKNGKNSVK
ncbi:MAG: hypothetical protein HY088_06970 [Ignavibacteriales bacterium]|nr:hypothetical protein [Ignavibacteriales bacterium]